MSLQIRRRSSYKVRVLSTVIAAMALAVQPLYGFVSYQIAHALPATTVAVTPNTLSIDGGNTKAAAADASNFTDLKLSFHYNANKLEAGEQLLYGWGAGQGTVASLGVIDGVSGNHEEGDVADVSLPAGADISNLSLSFSNTGTDGASDNVTVNNISLTGTPSTPATPIPNAVTLASRTTNSITLNFDITQDNAGGGIACFDVQADAATTLPDNEKSICLPVGWNSPITFSNVNSWIQVRENLLDGTNTAWQTFDVQPATPPADVTGPTITVTSPSTSVVSNAHDLVLSGTASDPSGVADVYVRAYDAAAYPTRVFTGTAALNGSNWTLTVPAGTFQDGHTILLQVFARDSLHNQSEKDVTFAVDNTAPAVPSDLSWIGSDGKSASNGFTNVQKGTLSWKDTTPSDVDHYVYKFWTNIPGYWNDPSHPWTDSYSYVKKTADGGYVPTDFANKEGTYYFCVAAVDAAGNDSGCSSTTAITYDITAPTNITATYTGGLKNVTTPTSVTGAVVGGNLTFQVSEVEQNPSNMYAEINWLNPATNKWEKHAGWGETITSDSGTLSLPATAPSGQYQIKISSIRDAAGNTAPTQTFGFTVDNTPPVAPTITPVSGADIKGDQMFTVTESNSGDLLSVVSSAGTLVDNHDGTYSLDTTAMTKDTKVTITATETDAAGNSTVATATYSVENAAPTVSGITMGHDANGQYWLTGSSTNSVGSSVSVLNGTTPFAGPVAVNADGSWTVPLGALPKSTSYNFTVFIKNTLGYSSSLTQTFTTAPLQTSVVTPSVTQGLFRSFATVATPVNTATTPAPTVKDNSNKGILGAQTTKSDKNISDTSVLSPSSQGWKILGFAWYWWLILIAAIVAFWYWLAAVRRRRADEAAYLNK